MFKVKIFGAGSIGNHMAHASRCLGWQVTVCDPSAAALERMRTKIYPSRYGHWDESIQLFTNDTAPKEGTDLIIVGTPPDYHASVALQALEENPAAILVEKPFCTPDLNGADEFDRKIRAGKTRAFVGYDHVVGKAARKVASLVAEEAIGKIHTLDAEFREHWGGIFAAHPWLDGPQDSYLGFWKRGGGASGEHSHAINLWQCFAHLLNAGRVTEVDGLLEYVEEGAVNYDKICFVQLKTESGFIGRVVQDVVTAPARKRARLTGSKGNIEWVNGYNPQGDAVIVQRPGQEDEVHLFPKKRPDDFIEELRHVKECVDDSSIRSPLDYHRGLETMMVIAGAHASHATGRRVKIDYGTGYLPAALK